MLLRVYMSSDCCSIGKERETKYQFLRKEDDQVGRAPGKQPFPRPQESLAVECTVPLSEQSRLTGACTFLRGVGSVLKRSGCQMVDAEERSLKQKDQPLRKSY